MIIEELVKRGILTKEQEKNLKKEIETLWKKEEEVILDKKILTEEYEIVGRRVVFKKKGAENI